MNDGATKPPRSPGVPGPQKNYQRAIALGFDTLDGQTEEQMCWLGAEPIGRLWRLPVLADHFEVDTSQRRMTASTGEEVGSGWAVLALHYLAITDRPGTFAPEMVFADLPESRSYAGVYQARVIQRLCATAGRAADTLRAAAAAQGGRPAAGGDLAFEFQMFPHVRFRLVWHGPDEEFPASATLLLPGNIEQFLCAEDVVVLSESLVARLGGRPF